MTAAKFYRFQESSLYAGRVLGGGISSRPLAWCASDMLTTKFSHAADFSLLFAFSGLSGGIIGDLAPSPPTRRPTRLSRGCRATGSSTGGASMNLATAGARLSIITPVAKNRSIARQVAPRATRRRRQPRISQSEAWRQSWPSFGTGCCKAYKAKNPLTPDEIASDSNGSTDGAVAKQHGLHTATPLWYYILKEAKVRHQGQRLGPVGSTIISEVFVGLVHGDPNSYLWKVKNGSRRCRRRRQAISRWWILLRFVNDINPIGD